jgi:hypothetical protein
VTSVEEDAELVVVLDAWECLPWAAKRAVTAVVRAFQTRS